MISTRAKRRIQENSISTRPQKMGKKEITSQDLDPSPVKEKEVINLHEEIEKIDEKVETGRDGWGILEGHEGLATHYRMLESSVCGWACDWAIHEQEYIDLLSEDRKNAIIHSLEGSCVQEDWDILLTRLRSSMRELIPGIFLETLILRRIHNQFFETPFWYLEGKLAEDDNDGDESFSRRLQYLYKKFLETNPYSATRWRSETIRLANSVEKSKPKSTDFGDYNEQRRNAALPKMVNELLASQPISWLLKKLPSEKEENERYDLMLWIFKNAARLSTIHATERGCLEFHRELNQNNETFTEGSDMTTIRFHSPNSDEPRLDLNGRRVLLIVHPAISIKLFNGVEPERRVTFTKAEVMVEDPEECVNGDKEPIPSTKAEATVEDHKGVEDGDKPAASATVEAAVEEPKKGVKRGKRPVRSIEAEVAVEDDPEGSVKEDDK